MISHIFLAAIFGLSFISPILAGLTFGFPYGSQKVRGVNLGGWLVLEAWITPSLFDATGDPRIVDEWTYCQYQDRTTATNALKRHWDTFITESDFAAISAAGLNHVRIPIGYWAYDVQAPEPFIQGQLPYLTKAIDWARKYNLKVIVDLHGAPGSQNGFDNSGQQTSNPQWFKNPSYVKRTNAIISRIAQTYRDMSGVVTMIDTLNEPSGWLGGNVMDVIKQFFYDCYGAIRWSYGTSRMSNTVVLIGDAFMPTSYWRGFMPYPNWDGVIIDRHFYQIYSDAEIRLTWDQHIQSACSRAADMTGATLWQLVGEWTMAVTDCASSHMFFSRSGGSRYETIGSCAGLSGKSSTFSQDYKTFLRKYFEAQVSTYEKSLGWLMWNWKTENADDRSYLAGLAGGWIPKNPTERKYPNICG